MAKVVGPLHSSEARGSVGSLCYVTWRGISVVKTRSGPTTQYSDAQVAIRTKAALATASWQSLTDAQRDAWHDYALNHLDIDWTGNPQRLTAYNWYVRANVRAQLCGAAIRTDPPTHNLDQGLTDFHIDDANGGFFIYWGVDPWPPAAGLRVEFYFTGPHSPARHPTLKQCIRLASELADSLYYSWTPIDPGFYTVFGRFIHPQGVVAAWHRTTGTAT